MQCGKWQSASLSGRVSSGQDVARVFNSTPSRPICHAGSIVDVSWGAASSPSAAQASWSRAPCSSRFRRSGMLCPPSAVEAPAPSSTDIPKLRDIELQPFINNQGLVLPPTYECAGVPANAFVVAIYDGNQKLQYIGFSQDLRNTLRTLLGRRPEKAHYYKAHGLPALDQAAMIAVREAWFQETGGAPSGNKLQLERKFWQSPVDGGAISARGKQGAAEEEARTIVAALQLRGLKEKFIPNPALLENGQVDFLPAEDLTQEERDNLIAAQQEAAAATRSAHTTVDGQDRTFQVRQTWQMKTKGGYMMDVIVTMDNKESKHRIIVGRQYVEGVGLTSPDAAAEAAMAVLLATKQARHSEGIMGVGQFPVNYFTVSEVEQWFEQDFKDAFKIAAGRELTREGLNNGVSWRFTRMHSYGTGFMEDQARKEARGQVSGGLGVRTSSFVYE